ncbi:MAG: DsrE family protein [Candidatus Thermoplasmatota archaeon]|nr:DsrE family protein [Candidatus Thermoplasmatota archaeon]MCL5665376.1 DsrE family protein [Candidatus Thermoplasmatota archaeon]
MTKVLFLLTSGKEAPEKADLAIISASRQAKAKRYDDVRALLFGPVEEYVTSLEGDAKEAFTELLKNGIIDSACVAVAKKYSVDQSLLNLGIELSPFGERLAKYVNDGYVVISL